MICQPCRRGVHRGCPENMRRANINGELPHPELAAATGQQCDCQHRPGPYGPGSARADGCDGGPRLTCRNALLPSVLLAALVAWAWFYPDLVVWMITLASYVTGR